MIASGGRHTRASASGWGTYTIDSCRHGCLLLFVHHITRGSLHGDLLLELGPDDLDELAGPSGPNPESDAQRVSGYRLLVSLTMNRVFSPGLSQESLRRAPNDCSLLTLRQDVLVEFVPRFRRTIIRVRIDSWLRPIELACDRHTTRDAHRMQEAGADLRPTDQQERPYRVERRLAKLAPRPKAPPRSARA
nr:hypothetical protein [Amycolatopsis acidiphila]